MRKYEIVNHDYGQGYILHFEDDTYALVNIETGDCIADTPESLMTFGFWADDDMQPVSDDTRRKIDEIVSRN